jgi:Sulfotransferase domain
MPQSKKVVAPNFFVIGTQKAGTTFLCHHLAKHENVSFGKRKELFFFGKTGLNKKKYRQFQKRHFAKKRVKETANVFVDGTANYYRSRYALKNMQRFVGDDFKVAMSLRHPVGKALSWYMHNYDKGRLKGDEPLLAKHFILRAQNSAHLRRWMKALGPERLLVLTYDTLQKDPLAFVNAATSFLSIAPVTELPRERVNAGSRLVKRGDFLEPILENGPKAGKVVPRFPLDELAALLKRVKRDVIETQAITGMDLSAWLELPEFKAANEAEIDEAKTAA